MNTMRLSRMHGVGSQSGERRRLHAEHQHRQRQRRAQQRPVVRTAHLPPATHRTLHHTSTRTRPHASRNTHPSECSSRVAADCSELTAASSGPRASRPAAPRAAPTSARATPRRRHLATTTPREPRARTPHPHPPPHPARYSLLVHGQRVQPAAAPRAAQLRHAHRAHHLPHKQRVDSLLTRRTTPRGELAHDLLV